MNARPVDVEIHLEGRTLTGTVAAVHENRIVTVLYSWLGAKHRLQAWIQLLALTAMAPEVGWQAVTIGRGGRSILGPVGDTFARRVLDDLIILYDLGRNEPLPFAPKTSAQYARIRMEDKSVTALQGVLEREWRGDRKRQRRAGRRLRPVLPGVGDRAVGRALASGGRTPSTR